MTGMLEPVEIKLVFRWEIFLIIVAVIATIMGTVSFVRYLNHEQTYDQRLSKCRELYHEGLTNTPDFMHDCIVVALPK